MALLTKTVSRFTTLRRSFISFASYNIILQSNYCYLHLYRAELLYSSPASNRVAHLIGPFAVEGSKELPYNQALMDTLSARFAPMVAFVFTTFGVIPQVIMLQP